MASKKTQQRRTKLTYNDKRELDQLTKNIPRLEEQTAALSALLNDAGDDYDLVMQLSNDLAKTTADLDSSETRWLELIEKSETMGGA